MARLVLSPNLFFTLFAGETGERRIYALHDSDYQPETPDPKAWVGSALGLRPEESTRAWAGRSDVIAESLLAILDEASGRIGRILLAYEAAASLSLERPLGDLVWRFLRPSLRAPVIVFAHNMCWRNVAYQTIHAPSATVRATWLRPRFRRDNQQVYLRPRPTGAFRLVVEPWRLPWRKFHEDDAWRIGFTVTGAAITRRQPGRDPVITMHQRLFVGNDAREFRPFLRAGINPACERLGYELGGNPDLPLVPFVAGVSDPSECAVLDVQLFKFWWLWKVLPHSNDLANFWFDELVLMFDRRDGGLLSLGIGSDGFIELPPDQVVTSDWGGFLARRFGIDNVAR